VRVFLLVFFTVAALAIMGSGVIGLLARSRDPDAPKRRMFFTGVFRLAVGLIVLGVTVRAY
jgi:uncharacterized membrane protein HdeD (DUF308 family)